jgi:SAM-dependent methyltransferase
VSLSAERVNRWLRAHPALDRVLRPVLRDWARRRRERSGSGLAVRARLALGHVRSGLGLGVSPAQVRWAYRELLQREPESPAAVASHLHLRGVQQLVDHVTRSPEYQARAGTASSGSRGKLPPITAEDFRRSIENHLRTGKADAELRTYIDVHFQRLLHTLNVLQAELPRGARLLDYSAAGFFVHAVRQLIGEVAPTSVTGVNFELDDYVARYGEEHYDVCLNTEVLEHLGFDPAHMVFSINRMLRVGGRLFLTTPNAVSMANAVKLLDGHSPALWNPFRPGQPYYERHNREWSPSEVQRLLEAHGFEVERLYTMDFYASTAEMLAPNGHRQRWLREHAGHAHFGDTLCVVARKLRRADAAARPDWLYG